MNRTASMLLVACALVSLPLAGCGESSNERTANIKGTPPVFAPGEDTSPVAQKQRMRGVTPGTKSAGGSVPYPKPG